MHDMLQPPGIVLCFASILALEPGGLAHFATVCTSFCWTNSGTHQRTSFNPLGDESKAYIREGSQLAGITSALMLLAWCKGCCVTLENPRHSKLEIYPTIQALVRFLLDRDHEGFEGAALLKHAISLGDFGAPSQKPIWLYSTYDITTTLRDAARNGSPRRPPSTDASVTIRCPGCNSIMHVLYPSINITHLVHRYKNSAGEDKVHGGPGLKTSQEYPARPAGCCLDSSCKLLFEFKQVRAGPGCMVAKQSSPNEKPRDTHAVRVQHSPCVSTCQISSALGPRMKRRVRALKASGDLSPGQIKAVTLPTLLHLHCMLACRNRSWHVLQKKHWISEWVKPYSGAVLGCVTLRDMLSASGGKQLLHTSLPSALP